MPASKPIAELYPLLRAMLLDEQDENGVWSYSDEQLQMGIASYISSGLAPDCIDINETLDTITSETLDSFPKQTIGLILLNTGLNFLTAQPAESFRTRALSHTVTAQAVKISVARYEDLIDQLRRKGGFCGEDTTGESDVIYSIGDAATVTRLSIGEYCD